MNHQRNANQNYMRYYFIPIRMVIRKSVGGNVEKFDPSAITAGNVKQNSGTGRQIGSSSKSKTLNYHMTQPRHTPKTIKNRSTQKLVHRCVWQHYLW